MNQMMILLLLLICYEASAQTYHTLVAPLIKDANTSLYIITLNLHQGYVVDLSAPLLWRHCPLRLPPPIACSELQCYQARAYPPPLCSRTSLNLTKNHCTCNAILANPIRKSCAVAPLSYSSLVIYWTDGKNPTITIDFMHSYISCAPKSFLSSLPKGVLGVAGLSWTPLALPSQFTPPFLGVSRKFAICLPSTSTGRGLIFFGDGPYNILPPTEFDAATILSYTPLLKHPRSSDYFVKVNWISINGKAIAVSSKSLALDSFGHGGVKLSTIAPYTILRRDIYRAFIKSFTKEIKGIPRVKTVQPFNICLNTSALGFSRVGLRVPQIDLVFANGKNWTIFGVNSMKQVGEDAACLAIIDGGKDAEQSMVIGSFQMENNFLLFDLQKSSLGFSSTLYFFRTTCSNFNFTTNG